SSYTWLALPSVELDYSRATFSRRVRDLQSAFPGSVPRAAAGRAYQFVDLDGEGIPGVLADEGGALYYRRNLGQGKLAPARALLSKPSAARLGAEARGGQQLLDVTGDGLPDLVDLGGPLRGFHTRSDDDSWGPLRTFGQLPNVDFSDPNLRFIDLDGDGFAEVVVSEDHVYTWYPSLRTRGFGAPQRASRYTDEARGPTAVFAEAQQTIFLADMSGDGLTDLVRIRNGSVCYWPNLGYGRFGPKVTMKGAPHMAPSNLYDPGRVRLADIDGSGPADLLYIGADGVHAWMNEAGNGFAQSQSIAVFPSHDAAVSTVDVVDLLGTGTACLVWSTPLQGRPPQVRYVDLLESKKPHLLTMVENNLGLETRIGYASATKFYLEDRACGRKWATRLPFPVQVVERVEHYDHVSRHKFVSTYRYRHGFYDPAEREFRGFGYVEQRDAESVSEHLGKGLFPDFPVENGEMPQPPVVTKTWFHTGAWQRERRLFEKFAAEWFVNPDEPRLAAPLVPETPTELSPPEYHQAHRALAGRMLRQEVYAEDGSGKQGKPYVVTQQTWAVRRLQPAGTAPFAAFLTVPCETLTIQYERELAHPRIRHELTLEVDALGYTTKSASVGYGHAPGAPQPEQERTWIAASVPAFKHLTDNPAFFRHGVATSAKSYEMGSGLVLVAPAKLLTLGEVKAAVETFAEVVFDAPLGAKQKRLLSSTRERYYKDDLSGPLPQGEVESKALRFESYALALTPAMLSGPLEGKVSAAEATAQGGYRDLDANGHYWAGSGTQTYDANAFYLVTAVTDVFGQTTDIDYDKYKLFAESVTDPLGNTIEAGFDYRVLQADELTDENGNKSEARFDELGRVVAVAVAGKNGEGDDLDNPTTRIAYELDRYQNNLGPVRVKTERRETHAEPGSRFLVSYSYSDGSGNEVMAKVSAEPGLAVKLDPQGHPVKDGQDNLVYEHADPRWVGTGRTVYDNKGNPIKQYEPYFSATVEYEDDPDIVQWGVTAVLHYDPLGRLIRTDSPDGSYARVEFDAWSQSTWDQNDTVLEPGNLWRAAHLGSPEEVKASAHADTPTVSYFDSLGRAFLVVEHNIVSGSPAYYETKSVLDIQGNVREAIDAKGRSCMSYVYGMLGQQLKQTSIDAGSRWRFDTAAGEAVRAWGERNFMHRTAYDALRRPSHVYVKQGVEAEKLGERLVYGEGHASAGPNNLRGRLVAHYDQSGVLLTEKYDFKGNLLEQSRRLATDYQNLVDWSAIAGLSDPAQILATASSQLQAESLGYQYGYDALDRPTSITTPDASEVRPGYNLAGLLESVEAKLRGAVTATSFVTDIDYDEKGRRTKIAYGNGSETSYAYDPLTFRLLSFTTTRSSDSKKLQSLAYAYDPVGNIVATHDSADQDPFFSAPSVPSADGDYTYDAIYRLIAAEGREHAAGADVQLDEQGLPIHAIPHPNDPSGLRRYTQGYDYDEVGNLTEMRHRLDLGEQGEWTRAYAYVPGTNRLATTSHGSLGTRSYAHDAHGNMTAMPHLAAIAWDYADRMRSADLGGGGLVYFVYDGSGQRVRKVWIHNGYRDERLYLGGYEIFRRTVIATATLQDERETLHLADDATRVCMVETLTVEGGTPVPSPVSRFRYQLDNHLGTACLEVDEAGAVISYEEYHPYGTSAYQAFQSSEVAAKRYRYIGKERDEETGLYAMGARHYAPWLGRWTAADPMGLGGDGPGLYNYARGSPLLMSDPSGTAPEDPRIQPLKHEIEALRETSTRASKTAQEMLAGQIKKIEAEIADIKAGPRAARIGRIVTGAAERAVAEGQKKAAAKKEAAEPVIARRGVKTREEAAKAAAAEALELTKAGPGYEYGASIFEIPGAPEEEKFSFTPAQRFATERERKDPKSGYRRDPRLALGVGDPTREAPHPKVPKGVTEVGFVHSHPEPGPVGFSTQDKLAAAIMGRTVYVTQRPSKGGKPVVMELVPPPKPTQKMTAADYIRFQLTRLHLWTAKPVR
ncbi:MAG: toxin, partial [Deltaproteobacteria bacterium]|nr:toxin [Deltaproteobacteria bacterium]